MRRQLPAVRRSATSVVPALLFLLTACPPVFAQCPDGTPPPCGRTGRTSAAAPANSVAVLYFENQSPDSADNYLAVGLTEAIIAKLGEIPRVVVKSRYLVRRFQVQEAAPAAVGRALNVAYIVTGGVQRAGGRLRVTAEMARASSGDRVWGQQYERADGDVFAIQEDIARGVATGVAGRLLPTERIALAARPTSNNAAYAHVLRGDVLLAMRTPAATQRAITEFEAATRLDPGYTAAWARIALAEALRLDYGWGARDGAPAPDSALRRGMAAARRALALDSSSSDAWLGYGYLLTFANARDWNGAEDAMRRAVQLDPHNAEAWHQLADLMLQKIAGRPAADSALIAQVFQFAADAYRRALAADPNRPVTLRNYSGFLPPDSQALFQDSAIALEPGSWAFVNVRAYRLLARGDTAGFRRAAAAALTLAPDGMRLMARAVYANQLLAAGDTTTARTEINAIVSALPDGPVSVRVSGPLVNTMAQLGDVRLLDILERTPRGLYAFGVVAGAPEQALTHPAMRRLYNENRPPWIPAR